MKKNEILCFSVFGIIFILIRMTYNFMREYELAPPLNLTEKFVQQVDKFNQYCRVLDFIQGIVLAIFLLYVGFFLAYGIRKLKIWIPAILMMVLLPYLIDFLFEPGDKSIWYLFRDKCIQTLLWIGAMRTYFIASKKIEKGN